MRLHDSEACSFCKSGQWFRAPMQDYPDAHVMAPSDVRWVQLTRRTEDPKLAWLERRLNEAGIPSRRDGSSFHAPILLVPEDREDAAWDILTPVDNIDDDEPVFEEES